MAEFSVETKGDIKNYLARKSIPDSITPSDETLFLKLSDLGYITTDDSQIYVKHQESTTSVPIWGSYLSDIADQCMYKDKPLPIAMKGSCPVPLYESNKEFYTTNISHKTISFTEFALEWRDGAYGEGVYISERSISDNALLCKSPILVIDATAGGGGGGGGAYNRIREDRRCTGGSGGSSSFLSILIDIKKMKKIRFEVGRGGTGGEAEKPGTDGNNTYIYYGVNDTPLFTVYGGDAGTRGYYGDDQNYGSGGAGGNVPIPNGALPTYVTFLHSAAGLRGTNGVNAPTNPSGAGASFTDTTRKFGDFFTLTDKVYDGGVSIIDTNTDWKDSLTGPGGAASARGSGGYGGMGRSSANSSNYPKGGTGGPGGGGGGGGACSNDPGDHACEGGNGGDGCIDIYWERTFISNYLTYEYEVTSDTYVIPVKDIDDLVYNVFPVEYVSGYPACLLLGPTSSISTSKTTYMGYDAFVFSNIIKAGKYTIMLFVDAFI